MTCTAARELLALAAVGAAPDPTDELLEPTERAALARHLAACAACRAEEDALRGAYDALAAGASAVAAAQPLAPGLRAQLLDSLAEEDAPMATVDQPKKPPRDERLVPDPERVDAVGRRIALSCSYCHGPTARVDVAFCAACLAPHHLDCFTSHGRCSTPGCEETTTVRPQDERHAAPPPRRPSWRVLAGGLAAAALVAGGAAALAPAQRSGRVADSPALVVERDAEAPRVDLTARDEALADVVARLAAIGPRRVVVEEGVDGRVTLDLRGVPWRDAVELVAQTADLVVVETSDGALALRRPGPRVSFDYHHAPLREVVADLSAQAGVPVEVARDADARISLRAVDAVYLEALHDVASQAGLVVVSDGAGPLRLVSPAALPQLGDAVLLRNGRRLVGRIVERTATALTFETAQGRITLPLDAVRAIEPAHGEIELVTRRLDQALADELATRQEVWLASLDAALARGDRAAAVERLDDVERRCRATLERGGDRDGVRRAVRSLLDALAYNVGRYPRGGAMRRPSPGEGPERRIELTAEGEPLAAVAGRLGRLAGRTILADPAVEATVSLAVRGLPWDQALDALAEQAGCAVVRRPGDLLLLTRPRTVSLEVTDGDLPAVLQELADRTGRNLLIDPGVRGTTTLALEDASFDEAFFAVAAGAHLQVQELGPDLFAVAPHDGPAPPVRVEARFAALRRRVGLSPVSLEATATPLADVVADLSEQLDRPLRLETHDPGRPLTVTFVDAPGGFALEALAALTGLRVEEDGADLVLREVPDNTLVAHAAPAEAWLALLAEAGGLDLALPAGARGVPVTLRLEDVSWADAVEATARSMGGRAVRDAAGRLRIEGGPADAVPLPAGRDLRLEAIVLGERARASISGRAVMVDDVVTVPGEARELRVTAIGRDGVELSAPGQPVIFLRLGS